jgi:hypothetical protein
MILSTHCVIGVALMAEDEQYTCGEGIADAEVAARNQWLMAAAPELLDACRFALSCLEDQSHRYQIQKAIDLATKGSWPTTTVLLDGPLNDLIKRHV